MHPSFLSFWILSNLLLVPTAIAARLAEPPETLELIELPTRCCFCLQIELEPEDRACPTELGCDTGDTLGLVLEDRRALAEAAEACEARPSAQVAIELQDGSVERLVLLNQQGTRAEACVREALDEHAFESPTRLAVGSIWTR